MSASEKVLSRIKKLMALADNTGNVHEAAVALRQAQALMMKYGVAPEAVELAEITSETCRNIPSNALSVPGWLNALVTVVCMIAGCRSYYGWYQHSDRKKRRSVTFYGIGERPAVACYLFGVVCRQLKRDAEHYLHTACTHPLLKLSTIRRRMDEYRLPAAQYCDEEKRCIQPGVVAQVVELCRQTPTGAVIDCQTERKKQSAPLAFSLSSLQQACSRHWGMPAQTVLDIAQKLYETHKLTSYPRTDCGYLPVSMREEIPQVLSAVVGTDPALQPVVAQLDTQFVSRIWNDKKITAHHGIIPTKHTGDLSKLSDEERNVYQLVRLHYLAQFMPLMEVDATEATFNIGGQLFRTRGNVVVKAGWKSLFGKMADDDEKGDEAVLPAMQAGQVCQVQGAEQKAQQTKPPAPYNDGTLIAAMTNAAAFVTDAALKKVLKENAGIGTEATRAGIIDTLVKRGFLVREKKALRSTPLGRSLVDVLPGTLTNPGLTALWEQMLDEVAAGKVSLDDFMAKQSQWVSQLVAQGKSQPLAMQVPPSPLCPVCGGKTSQRKGKNGSFWGCLNYPDCKGIVGDGGNAKTLQGQGRSSLPTRLKIKLR